MKKAIFTVVLCVSGAVLAGTYSGGDGTAGNPYQIGTVEDWFELMDSYWDWGQHFILTENLDFEGASLSPVGTENYLFTGNFDGQNHIIRNVVINKPTTDYVGLFGRVETGGTMCNLGVEDVKVIGRSFVGGLAGSNYERTITSCYATGSVSGTSSVGGLVGSNVGMMITSCYATVAVNGKFCVGGLVGWHMGQLTDCYATEAVSGTGECIGGLVGINVGTITSCYATGAVSGTGVESFHVGGLVGSNGEMILGSGMITTCYSNGTVCGFSCVGGLVGSNYQSKVIRCYATGKPTGTSLVGGLVGNKDSGSGYEDTGNFWDIETSEINTSAMGTGKTTVEMKTLATFTDLGWDFSNTDGDVADWFMPKNDYPRLAWENLPAFLEISDVPENLSMGTGETRQFSFTIARKVAGADVAWTAAADSNCPWITGIDPNSGVTNSPEDSNTVTVTVDAGLLELGDYPVRLLVSDGYIFYEVSLSMNLFDRVNLDELAILTDYWMIADCNESQPCSEADWYIDGKINLRDFAQLAQSWLGEEILLDRPGLWDYFESGTFNDLPWEHGGNASWVISADNKYEGTYAAQSGTITDFQTSTLSLTMNAEDGSQVDSISFARKVSSEASYDYLRFYVDGVEKTKWSGEQDWAIMTYTFTPGAHTFKWAYTKDGSRNVGSDRAWIDAVRIYPKP